MVYDVTIKPNITNSTSSKSINTEEKLTSITITQKQIKNLFYNKYYSKLFPYNLFKK